MTKISDKLKRLHGSRIRALDSNPRNEGVFIADTYDPPIPPSPKNQNDLKFASILRNQSLKGKSQHKRSRSSEFGAYKLMPEPIVNENTAHEIGDRVKDLRIQASALIDAGRGESALPLLFEIVAFAPENNFGLARLKTHYERAGQTHLALIFEKRLRKIANY